MCVCVCGESLDVPTAALERDQWPKAAAYEKLSMTVMKLHHPPGDMGVKTESLKPEKLKLEKVLALAIELP